MSQITSHVLDTARGLPAAGLSVALAQRIGEDWKPLTEATTNADGRAPGLVTDGSLPAGIYRLRFDTGSYFAQMGVEAFYPWVEVVFSLAAGGDHYHVPLLLSPYGYSTYRGS